MSRNTLSSATLLLVCFLGGFQIMVLEVCGFRVLQTNLGSSVVVTGTLLTLVMVLLSAGYYCGGILARGNVRILLALLIAAASYTQVSNVIFADAIAGWALDLRDRFYGHPVLESGLPAVALALVLYGFPVFVISMISPVLIRLRTREGDGDAGRSSGFFMALSTAGSIVGTMVGSYWMVPFHGVAATVSVANGVFATALGLAYVAAGRVRWTDAAVCATVLAIGLSSSFEFRRDRTAPDVLFERESFYGAVRVVASTDEAGRRLLEYQPSRVYTHSVLYPDEPLRELAGLQYLVGPSPRTPREILVLGSAAGGVIRQIEQVFPSAVVTGVDIDPLVHVVARELFGVDPRRVILLVRDARVFLEETPRRYDLIIVDLFSGEFIPPHCISREFFRLVRQRLAPDGTLFINTNMNDVPFELPDGADAFRPIRHLQSTLQQAGFDSQFENRFFHSIYAYPYPLSEGEFIGALERQFQRVDAHPALRAAAGLAAMVTTAVPDRRARYRSFTESWVPVPLLELKSNEHNIYRALSRRGDAVADVEPTARGLLDELIEEGERFGYFSALRDPSALLMRYESPAGSDPLPGRAWAAQYLRFSAEMPNDATMPGRSPLADLVSRYAQMYRLAFGNDYEALLEPLRMLISLLPVRKSG